MMQTVVPDALQALMVLAQQARPTTPDGAPTVAAQLAQTSAAPQGISQGMPQAVSDYESAEPSVMRNMQQEQLQQMVQQASQPRPAGIEGLPAPNMNFAEGGVIGYNGESGSQVLSVGSAPDYQEARKYGIDLSPYDAPAVRAQKLERVQRMRDIEKQRQAGGPPAEIPNEVAVANTIAGYRDPRRSRLDVAAAPAAAPRPAGPRSTARPTAAPTPTAPAAVPATGIAQNLPTVPTLQGAMQEVERTMPGSGTADSRKALEELQRMRRERPESGIGTIKALEEEQRVAAELKRQADESRRGRGIAEWLAAGPQLGASGRSMIAFREGEQRRQMLHAQENTIRVAKMDAIKEANAAQRIGDQEKYVEALNKIAELDRADKQIKAQLAAQTVTAQTAARGQDITAGTAAEDRASRERESAANRASQERVAKLQIAAREGDPRKVYDTITDNVQKEYDAWSTSVEGVRSSPEQKITKRKELLEQQIRIASAMGITGLDKLLAAGTATPTTSSGTKLKYNPATGKIE